MKALTANRLLDGEVVFWNQGEWAERFSDAQIFEDEALGEAAVAQASSQPTIVVEPYLIDLTDASGALAPVSYRERLRALGPTNEPGHGKQAEGGDAIENLKTAAGAARSKGRVDLIRRK